MHTTAEERSTEPLIAARAAPCAAAAVRCGRGPHPGALPGCPLTRAGDVASPGPVSADSPGEASLSRGAFSGQAGDGTGLSCVPASRAATDARPSFYRVGRVNTYLPVQWLGSGPLVTERFLLYSLLVQLIS